MFKTNEKAEAAKELKRINDEIESSFAKFNIIRTIPTILCVEDAINGIFIEHQRKILAKEIPIIDPRYPGLRNFVMESNEFLNIMLVNILNKGFLDRGTKILDVGISIGISIERDYHSDIRNFINQLQEENYIGKKYFIRIQERLFLDRYPGAIIIVLDGKYDKKIVQNLDRILELRQLMYKKGLLETMIYLAPKGTEIDFNDKGTFVKYPDNFTFETAYQKLGLSHRLIENFTPTVYWNSNLPSQVKTTLKNISKGKINIENLKLEQNEIYKAYNNMVGFNDVFRKKYSITLKEFLDIVNEFIFDCYPHDNTLGIWKVKDLSNTIARGHNVKDVKQVIRILSNLDKSNVFYGMVVVNETIFSTFERLTESALFALDNCFDEMYENDSKGKNFEDASRRMLMEKGLIVLPHSVEIFEPMVPKNIALKLWGKEKNRTDLDIVALKSNALLIIECKDTKFHSSLLNQGNKFKNYVVEQYYRTQWIKDNFQKFCSYVENEFKSLGIDFSKKLLLLPLVVSNTLVNIENFEGAPLITYSELEDLVSKEWNVSDNSAPELLIEIKGRLHRLPWFAIVDD